MRGTDRGLCLSCRQSFKALVLQAEVKSGLPTRGKAVTMLEGPAWTARVPPCKQSHRQPLLHATPASHMLKAQVKTARGVGMPCSCAGSRWQTSVREGGWRAAVESLPCSRDLNAFPDPTVHLLTEAGKDLPAVFTPDDMARSHSSAHMQACHAFDPLGRDQLAGTSERRKV